MNKTTSISLLASFATIKSLSDVKEYHSPYQILAEFIKHIVISESKYAFSSFEMKSMLNEYFGFDIPEAVIKTASKRITGITLETGIFSVSPSEMEIDPKFAETQKASNEINASIIDILKEYIQNRSGACDISSEALSESLMAFLIEDQALVSGKYTDLIGEFVLKNENNSEIQEKLNDIREGSVLYLGLNHNIGETGSISKPLTLYLGTEVLFSLFGYNGELYKQLADDFFNQVRAANADGKKRITLKYFYDVKIEIDDFFFTAENIVSGKRAKFLDKPAMIAITSGCTSSSDVTIKKSDFYHNLQFGYGILEDSFNDYYSESLFKTNLESFEYDDEEDKAKKKELGIKYISHINKLRSGKRFENDIDSEYLLVTNAKATLLISREQTDRIKNDEGIEHLANFAVTLDKITSLLWYKLGNGFGKKDFPTNVNAVLRARAVLSSSIAKKVSHAFFDTKKEYESGKITVDALAARVIMLRNKPMLPEELQGDDIDTIMDFSPEFLSRYEEQVKSDRKALKEKEDLIESLKLQAKTTISEKDERIAAQASIITEKDITISEKDSTIASQQNTIQTKEEENSLLRTKLASYEEKEAEKARKKKRRKNIFRYIGSIAWKVLAIVIITGIAILLEKKLNSQIPVYICSAVDILCLIGTIITALKSDKNKYLK